MRPKRGNGPFESRKVVDEIHIEDRDSAATCCNTLVSDEIRLLHTRTCLMKLRNVEDIREIERLKECFILPPHL